MPGIATALAIGKAGLALGKNIAARVKKKKAEGMGAGLEDPNQVALRNVMQRKFRMLQTGTSRNRHEVSKDMKNLSRSSILAGRRNLSDLSSMRSDIESNIAREESGRGEAMLPLLQKQTSDVADRKMDLLEQDKAQTNLDASTMKSSSGKNLNAILPGTADDISDMSKKKKPFDLKKKKNKTGAMKEALGGVNQ